MNYGSTDLESNMYADDNSIELNAFFKRKTTLSNVHTKSLRKSKKSRIQKVATNDC